MSAPLLRLEGVEAAYDRIIIALRGVSLEVAEGSIVALLGGNGAGKTTTLKAAAGLLTAERGAVTRGSIHIRGRERHALTPAELVRAGIVQVLEGRHVFPHLSIEENLITGALARGPGRAELRDDLEKIYGYFPRLRRLADKPAGYASGGEQQMVALGRALMARPSLVLLDEPSMGLAPLVVEEIFATIAELNQKEGVSFLLAEQNARLALRHAHHGYVLENGRVVASGSAAELRARPDVKAAYLGVGRAPSAVRAVSTALAGAALAATLFLGVGGAQAQEQVKAAAVVTTTPTPAPAAIPPAATPVAQAEPAPQPEPGAVEPVTAPVAVEAETASPPADLQQTAIPLADKVKIGGGAILWFYQPVDLEGVENNFDLFYANLIIDAKLGNLGLHIEPRFRASKLRPFFDGPAWVEEAYVHGSLADTTLKVGKIYSRLGLFWDDSFYGSVLVYDGLKLAPDYGVSLEGQVGKNADFGLSYWAQYFVVDGQTNVSLQGRDTISYAGARRRNEVVGRAEPFYKFADQGIVKVGASFQFLQADLPSGKEDVYRGGGDVTVKYKTIGFWGEFLHQSGKSVDGFPIAPLDAATPGQASESNNYVLTGASYGIGPVTLRYNFSYGDYSDLDITETLHEPAVAYAVSPNLGVLAELVLWERQLPDTNVDVDKSLNVTLAGSF